MQFGRSIAKVIVILLFSLSVLAPSLVNAEPVLKGIDGQVFALAVQCREEVINRLELLLRSGKLTVGQLFDTFYIPMPNTTPQKFKTQYDSIFDANLQSLLDGYQKKNSRFIYFILADFNGYVPTHNSKFSQPLTGNKEVDAKKNRTKIMFNDRTGLAAARNKAQYLLQEYARDTGETMYDLSVPVFIRGQHWGCVRVGYK